MSGSQKMVDMQQFLFGSTPTPLTAEEASNSVVVDDIQSTCDDQATGDTGSGKFFGNIALTSSESNDVKFAIGCDDCAVPHPFRCWRWCENCQRLLCEGCILDKHTVHDSSSYQSAVRDHHQMLSSFNWQTCIELQEIRLMTDSCRSTITQVVDALNETKTQLQRLGNKVQNSFNELNGQFEAFQTLIQVPLCAQIVSQRKQMMDNLKLCHQQTKQEISDVAEDLTLLKMSVDSMRTQFSLSKNQRNSESGDD